ncbi:DUF1348 family protein [Roseomonas sp. HF4]|uniref:DUF1348 family protein n=1 Tax=Roseomonas sp. HF4 TaxID=2562313 RepID=UPI0010C14BA8|nr:DUF1348 family protein [Roseomonas sp. HF4]
MPPFSRESATLKVRAAEEARNGPAPAHVARANTEDGRWRNRAEFPEGHEETRSPTT